MPSTLSRPVAPAPGAPLAREDLLGVAVADRPDGTAWVRVSGELCFYSAPLLETALLGLSGRAGLVVDLREVSFLDLPGCRALVDAHRRARAVGARFAVAPPPAGRRRAFDLLDLGRHLDLA